MCLIVSNIVSALTSKLKNHRNEISKSAIQISPIFFYCVFLWRSVFGANEENRRDFQFFGV